MFLARSGTKTFSALHSHFESLRDGFRGAPRSRHSIQRNMQGHPRVTDPAHDIGHPDRGPSFHICITRTIEGLSIRMTVVPEVLSQNI